MLLSGMTLIGLNFRLYGSDSVNRHMNLIEGVIYVVFSLIALYPPEISTQMATILVGTFALNSGVFQITGGFMVRPGNTTFGVLNRWSLILAGLWSLLIGIAIFLLPETGILTILWIVGVFLVIVGILNIATDARLSNKVEPA
jgi:uncharacterized membrane protein HdeD (DUF308 family)